jgi:hypothetical protein
LPGLVFGAAGPASCGPAGAATTELASTVLAAMTPSRTS